MKKKQLVVGVDRMDGAYSNFFFAPGSIGSLRSYILDGWIAILIKDIGDACIVLFEKELP